MNKLAFRMFLFILTGFLFSCMSWPPPSSKNPYRPLSKVKNAVVIDTLETPFLSHGIAGYRDENANISKEAYNALLKLAKEKYGNAVDVVDITWSEVKWVSGPNPSEFIAGGKVISFEVNGIDDALARAAKEAAKNIPKNSAIAIIYITANDDRTVSDYISRELEFMWVTEGYIICDRSQLEILRKEHNFQISGEVDDTSSVSIGKMLGARFIVTGSFDGYGNMRRLRLRVLNTQTGQVIGAASEQLK